MSGNEDAICAGVRWRLIDLVTLAWLEATAKEKLDEPVSALVPSCDTRCGSRARSRDGLARERRRARKHSSKPERRRGFRRVPVRNRPMRRTRPSAASRSSRSRSWKAAWTATRLRSGIPILCRIDVRTQEQRRVSRAEESSMQRVPIRCFTPAVLLGGFALLTTASVAGGYERSEAASRSNRGALAIATSATTPSATHAAAQSTVQVVGGSTESTTPQTERASAQGAPFRTRAIVGKMVNGVPDAELQSQLFGVSLDESLRSWVLELQRPPTKERADHAELEIAAVCVVAPSIDDAGALDLTLGAWIVAHATDLTTPWWRT